MYLLATIKGDSYWAQYDKTAEVIEIFKSEDGSDYIGCADTRAEAVQVARHHSEEC